MATVDLIEKLRLPHSSGRFLSAFVENALSPVSAARYVKGRLALGDARSLVSDWSYIVECITHNGCAPPSPDSEAQRLITMRDGGKCCVTGKAGTYWDPLVVAPILPIPSAWVTDKPQNRDMLGAFFGPRYRDWWFSHWLVRTSTARALLQGTIKLERLQPSMVEYQVKHVLIGPEKEYVTVNGSFPLLGDHSRSKIDIVDPRFVGSHARFCLSMRFHNLAKEIAALDKSPAPQRLPARPQAFFFSPTALLAIPILAVWLMFPSQVRIAVYKKLRVLGERLYGPPYGATNVQKLPFGLYLKYMGESDRFRNEFNALQVVRQHTSIPVPQPLDVVWEETESDGDVPVSSESRVYRYRPDDQAYLLITEVPGVRLQQCLHITSDRDNEHIATQLKDYMAQLRAIPKSVNPEMAICNTLGEPCRDPRLQGEFPIGPFPDEASFSRLMRYPDDPARHGHKIVFTHADLNPRNILVERVVRRDGTRGGWAVRGIVDWETAGYYPEYWDATKARFEGWPLRHTEMMKEVFNEFGDYSKEYEVEKRAWESGDGV
ncbi:hypothetical protein B0T26DRAFT_739204 [Lasiosphaeria miniovina]|uniref:Aminoglycoside phosphotransferase domain-containing protein n=1 Tax=Lasiosphaeria miniovina TaxID=1954250 RepID=A0AA40ATJ8_9PEZI|nr:uncharacterized protein B0T26DRAFT_739204 [Lasiosphaeria miniovina]KAK0721768.1 hypothetical protein B0T26DRAFT_739204 [Lasiosphaeria miniovina]